MKKETTCRFGKQFNKNLKKLRHASCLTQEEFAMFLGVKRCTLGAYEENRAAPPIALMLHVCNTFNVGLNKMLTNDIVPGVDTSRVVTINLLQHAA